MERVHPRPAWNIAHLDSRISAGILACLVAILCYQADRIAYLLRVPPDYVASFWPATPLLVAVLLLVPRRIWPVLIGAGLGAMAIGDFQNGVPITSIIFFSLGDLAAVLVATLGISRLFEGVAHLSGMKTLAKYFVVAVILAPFVSAFLGAIPSARGGYWLQWRLWFFSDSLAFLTVTPVILNWACEGRAWARRSRNYLELAALMTLLILFGYPAFLSTWRVGAPALLYSIVPLLLWAALRLGLKGVSASMIIVAFLSVWGASHGRGPFTGEGPLNTVLSLQLFLIFAATPFMVLAAIVEDQKRAQQALIEEGAQLAEAQHLAQVGSWQWDPQSDTVTWSRELYRIVGRDPNLPAATYKEHSQLLSPKSWEQLQRSVEEAARSGTPYELDLEYVRPDGSTVWARARGEAQRDITGRIVGLRGTAQDMTERRLAEKELALANDRFRLAMEFGKTVGWDRDVKTGQDTLFGDLQSVFGIPLEVYKGRVEDFRRYLHPKDRERVLEAIEDAMEGKKPYAAEFRILRVDGTVRWVAAKGKFYYSPKDEPERMLGTAVDITERKLMEGALRESEERLRLAAQAGKMYAYDWDIATDVIIRSEEATCILGLTDGSTKVTHRQVLACVHPEDRAKLISLVSALTPESPNIQFSGRYLRPNGSMLWLERTGRAFFDEQGKIVRMIGMIADITERKLVEEALRRSEGYLSQAERLAHTGSWAWDVHTGETFWSKELFRLLGYDPERTKPSLPNFLARVHPDDRTRAERRVEEEAGGLDVVSEYRIVLPDGTTKHLQAIGHPIKNESGEVVEVVGTTVDVTQQKLAEEALSTVSQKLIEAQEQERSRIARELHDDINQRLALLGIGLQRMQQDLPCSAIELSGRIADAWQAVRDLANDVQNLSHQLHSPKLELLGLVSAAASFCRELSDQKGVEIDFKFEDMPKELTQEVSLPLFRVLQEALQNSIKHSGSRRIQVSLRQEANEVELAVHDSGVGFELEEAIKGRGLGLTSMIERLKVANGRLSIDSDPQHGTRLHARVPLSTKGKSARATG